MKRLLISLFLIGAACIAMCQAPFTIVRPADGAKVREQVRVLIPKNSVPKTGYVGFFLDGKFMEAIVPNLSGRYYEYVLDTKGRAIEDGKHTLEAVLYVDYSDEPRIVDRSSVSINVANKANITLPSDGLLLRYKFKTDQQLTYTVLQRVMIGSVDPNAAAIGDSGADLPLDYEKIRMTYGVENAYGNGDGLIRMQAAPLKNKKYAMYTPDGQTAPQLFWDHEMAPIYMRLTNTGLEVFGSVPQFIPFQNLGPQGGQEFFADWPLPTLPSKRVKPGDVWQTRFQIGKNNLRGQTGTTSVVSSFPARGEFKSLEWEMGHPCAKLYHVLAAGGALNKSAAVSKRSSMDETIWFALDKGQVIKVVRNQTYDTMTNPNVRSGPGKSAGNGNGTPSGGGGGRGKFGGGGAAGDGINFDSSPGMNLMLQGKGRRGGFGGLGGGDTGTGFGAQRGGSRNSGGQGAPQGNQNQQLKPTLVRLSIQQIFILEQ